MSSKNKGAEERWLDAREAEARAALARCLERAAADGVEALRLDQRWKADPAVRTACGTAAELLSSDAALALIEGGIVKGSPLAPLAGALQGVLRLADAAGVAGATLDALGANGGAGPRAGWLD
ncbi:MAG: hypothetical protein ACK57N_06365 [Planctomycetia bacterium]|jgi:hypothetical protein